MSWLEDSAKKIVYNYVRADEVLISGTLDELIEKTGLNLKAEYKETFNYLGDTYTYCGFEPRENNIMTKIVFEQNGRKAIKVQHTDGKCHVRSMTKENLLKGVGAKKTEVRYDHKGIAKGSGTEQTSVITKDFKRHTDKLKENQVQQSLKDMKQVIAMSNARSKK